MSHELTIKEYASLERVTERTVKNWIAKGAITVRRTPGGRVRIQPDPSLCFIGVKHSEKGGTSAA